MIVYFHRSESIPFTPSIVARSPSSLCFDFCPQRGAVPVLPRLIFAESLAAVYSSGARSFLLLNNVASCGYNAVCVLAGRWTLGRFPFLALSCGAHFEFKVVWNQRFSFLRGKSWGVSWVTKPSVCFTSDEPVAQFCKVLGAILQPGTFQLLHVPVSLNVGPS